MKQSMPWDWAATRRACKSSRSSHQGFLCCEVIASRILAPSDSRYWLAILDGSGQMGEAGGCNPCPIWDFLHATHYLSPER